MPKHKIAITVERGVLAGAEALSRRTHESRSALIERALRHLLREEQHRDRVTEYVAAYRRAPETAGEVRAAGRIADAALALLPWEDT